MVESYTDGEEPLKFYYNREERLKRAPSVVQNFYKNGLQSKTGFFRVLVASRGNKFLFLTLVVSFALVSIVSFFGPKKNECALKTTVATLQSFSIQENEEVYVRINVERKSKFKKSKNLPPENIFAVVKTVDRDANVIDKTEISELFKNDGIILRTTFHDYGIISVVCEISDGSENGVLIAPVKKQ